MIRAILMIVLSVAFSVALCGCGGSAPAAQAPTPAVVAPVAPTSATTAPANVPADIPNSSIAIIIVDLQGKPLSEMAAIVTEDANAFEQPIVRGAISGADGKSDLLVPRDRVTYVRGWDPKLGYFANSFLTIDAGDAPLPADTTVIMAPAAQYSAQIYGADGAPLPEGTPVEILLSHPTQGPWWPARGKVDAQGRLVLPNVPAGQFDLEITTETHGTTRSPGQLLPPSTLSDGGVLHLQ